MDRSVVVGMSLALMLGCSSKGASNSEGESAGDPGETHTTPLDAAAAVPTNAPIDAGSIASAPIDAAAAPPPLPEPTAVPVTPALVSSLRACTSGEGFADGDLPPTKVETIGTRPATQALHVHGKSARYYVFRKFDEYDCVVFPVRGKPMSYTKGDVLGTGTTQSAYVLDGVSDYGGRPPVALSLKDADDRLVDVIALDCENYTRVSTIRAFDDRDMLMVGCERGMRGNDVLLVEVRDRRLHVVLKTEFGDALLSGVFDMVNGLEGCERPPTGSLTVVQTGPRPAVEIVRELYGDREIDKWMPDYEPPDGEVCIHPSLYATWTYDPSKHAFAVTKQRAAPRRLCNCTLPE